METETYRGTVYPWHCDFNEHMNVQHYMAKFDEATWQFFFFLGITPHYLKQESRGIVAVEQHLKYYEELHAGDLIHINTRLIELKPKALVLFHQMMNTASGKCVADARMVGVHIDKKTRKSVSFPDEIIKRDSTIISSAGRGQREA